MLIANLNGFTSKPKIDLDALRQDILDFIILMPVSTSALPVFACAERYFSGAQEAWGNL